jgi:hypothetical protein
MPRKDDAAWYRMMATSTKFFIRVDLLIAGTITVIALTANPRSDGWLPPALVSAIAIYLLAGYFRGQTLSGLP